MVKESNATELTSMMNIGEEMAGKLGYVAVHGALHPAAQKG